jgi:16S rRNA (guanine527-N7)-methyltransferase
MMGIGSNQWRDLILEGASQLGVKVTVEQADKFAVHGRELLLWNRKTNLTAITDPVEVAVKHFLDSLAALPEVPAEARLLDIGSGGGFPGLPLKVMRPKQNMTLIDGAGKKINFIKHVIRRLSLEKVEALHVRAEDLAAEPLYAGAFEVVICRALADLRTLVRLAWPLLSPHGAIIAYKGPQGDAESKKTPPFTRVEHQDYPRGSRFETSSRQYCLPISGDSRQLIILQRH